MAEINPVIPIRRERYETPWPNIFFVRLHMDMALEVNGKLYPIDFRLAEWYHAPLMMVFVWKAQEAMRDFPDDQNIRQLVFDLLEQIRRS